MSPRRRARSPPGTRGRGASVQGQPQPGDRPRRRPGQLQPGMPRRRSRRTRWLPDRRPRRPGRGRPGPAPPPLEATTVGTSPASPPPRRWGPAGRSTVRPARPGPTSAAGTARRRQFDRSGRSGRLSSEARASSPEQTGRSLVEEAGGLCRRRLEHHRGGPVGDRRQAGTTRVRAARTSPRMRVRRCPPRRNRSARRRRRRWRSAAG